jgi:hypothetical protein
VDLWCGRDKNNRCEGRSSETIPLFWDPSFCAQINPTRRGAIYRHDHLSRRGFQGYHRFRKALINQMRAEFEEEPVGFVLNLDF